MVGIDLNGPCFNKSHSWKPVTNGTVLTRSICYLGSGIEADFLIFAPGFAWD